MHIHGNSMNFNVNSISAAGAESAAARQRAAETRKKLLKTAGEIDAVTGPEADYLVGQWLDGQHSDLVRENPYPAAATGKDPNLG